MYKAKLASYYTHPEQLLFFDETANKGFEAMRMYAWAPRGKMAIAQVPLRKESWLSVLAACDTRVFVAWKTTDGTFSRSNFHAAAFLEKVVPLLNPWPQPQSIVVLDNASIHVYREVEDAVHQCGAILHLPPHCPHLNSVGVFSAG